MPATESIRVAQLAIENQELRAEIDRTRLKLEVARRHYTRARGFGSLSRKTIATRIATYAGLFLVGSAFTGGLYAIVAKLVAN